MVVIIAFLFGLALGYMGVVQNGLMLGIGFTAIRMLGNGALVLVSQTVLNQWWVQRRGTIMGISGLILAVLGMGAFPNLVQCFITSYGWRVTYPILGAILIFGMVPVGYLLFSNRPEDYGLRPENLPLDEDQVDDELATKKRLALEWTLSEAMHTRPFWILLTAVSLFTMISTGEFFHLVSIFNDHGLSSEVAASAFIPLASANAGATLVCGMAIDRFPVKGILFVSLVFQALNLFMVQHLSSMTSAYLFGILLGITGGFFQVIGSVVWPAFYGRLYLGSIYGFTSAASVFGAALGPLLFGIVRDGTGNYGLILSISAALTLLLGLMALFVRKPVKQST